MTHGSSALNYLFVLAYMYQRWRASAGTNNCAHCSGPPPPPPPPPPPFFEESIKHMDSLQLHGDQGVGGWGYCCCVRISLYQHPGEFIPLGIHEVISWQCKSYNVSPRLADQIYMKHMYRTPVGWTAQHLFNGGGFSFMCLSTCICWTSITDTPWLLPTFLDLINMIAMHSSRNGMHILCQVTK